MLVKPVKAAFALMPDAPCERSYEYAKELLLVENVDDSAFRVNLFEGMYEELPALQKRNDVGHPRQRIHMGIMELPDL